MDRNGFPRAAAIAGAVALVAIAGCVVTALAITGKLDGRSTPLVVSLLGTVATLAVALVGAAFAERASRDIRNGIVLDKARQGAHAAILEAGVVTRQGPAITAEMAALTELVLTTRRVGEILEDATAAAEGRHEDRKGQQIV